MIHGNGGWPIGGAPRGAARVRGWLRHAVGALGAKKACGHKGGNSANGRLLSLLGGGSESVKEPCPASAAVTAEPSHCRRPREHYAGGRTILALLGEQLMRAKCLVVVAAALFLVAADDAAKKDLDNLQGIWESTSATFDGRDISDDAKFKMKFKGDTITITGNEEITKDYGAFKVKLDPSTTPKSMDLTVTAGDMKDSVLEGIYELKGDELKVCVKIGARERPTKFESKEGSSTGYVVYKRFKP
jgi:uncharacterized protein (TIGR03067 family)